MLNRKEAPSIVDTVNLNLQLKPTEKFTLDNGVEVYAVSASGTGIVGPMVTQYTPNPLFW